MRIPIQIDSGAIAPGLRQVESAVDAAMARVQARINAVKGPALAGRGGMSTDFRMANREASGLVKTLTGVGTLSTGLGIGAAVGGVALLEQGLERSIRKAREFQTATLAIAATLGSIGEWKVGPGGKPMSQGQQTQRNMWEAEKYRMQILERSAKNILTFEEQLNAFQGGLSSGARKGLNPDQVMKLTEQTAVVAKTLGLRGEQIANASRLMMGGGVNIARSTIGRALGITNADISTRQGPELERFLSKRVKGFEQMQGQFENSIEGLSSTLEAKIDVMASRIGDKFFKGIAPTMKQIGLLSEPDRKDYKSGKEYAKAMGDYKKQSETMDKVVGAAADAFNGLFEGVKSVVESDTFKTLLDILVQISKVSKTIMLAAIFSKIAGAVGAATGALSKFLTLVRGAGASALGGGGGGGGMMAGGVMPADIIATVLTGGGRGPRGGTAGLAGALGLAGFSGADPNSILLRQRQSRQAAPTRATLARIAGYNASQMRNWSTAMVMSLGYGAADHPAVTRYGSAATDAVRERAGRAGREDYHSIRGGLASLGLEEAELQNRAQFLRGSEQQDAMSRLDAIGMERIALQQQMAMIPYGSLPLGARIGRRWDRFSGHAQSALPMAMTGIMGGQLAKEIIPGAPGNFLGNTLQGASIGYLMAGLTGTQNIGPLLNVGGIASSLQSGWANRSGLNIAGIRGGLGRMWSGIRGGLGRMSPVTAALAAGAVSGVGTSVSDYYASQSMEDLNERTTAGQQAGMALGGAAKWGGMGFMVGGAPGAVIGATAGAILEPLYQSMKKAEAQAKASAAALDEMQAKFPRAAKGVELRGQIRGVDAEIAAIKGGKRSHLSDPEGAIKALEAKRKNLQKQYDENFQEGTFEGQENELQGEVEKLKLQLETAQKYGGTGYAASKKMLKLQEEYAKKDLELNKGNIPVDFDMEKFAEERKNTKDARYAQWQEDFQKWSAPGTGNEGEEYADYVTELAEKKTKELQENALPALKAQIETQYKAQGKILDMNMLGTRAMGSDRKSLASYYDMQAGIYDKASMFDKGMDDPAFKKYQAGMMSQYRRGMREEYDMGRLGLEQNNIERVKTSLERSRLREDVTLKMSHLRLDAQKIEITGQQTELEAQRLQLQSSQIGLAGRKLDLQGQALNDEEIQTKLGMARNDQQMKRTAEDYRLAKTDASLGYQGALLNQRKADLAPALFYGSMGPASEAAGHIRYKVESEFAAKFDPGQYEDAYRESLQMQEEQMGLDKQLAEQATKRAGLGLDRIEEDYANAMVDLTLQMRGLSRHMEEIGIGKEENALAKKGNALDKDENALAQQSNKIKAQENSLADTENKIAQKRTGQDAAIADKELALKQKGLNLQDQKQRRELGELGKTIKETGGGNIPGLPGVGVTPGTYGALPGMGNAQYKLPGMPAGAMNMGNGMTAIPMKDMAGKSYYDEANGYSLLDEKSQKAFQDAMKGGNVGKALQISNPTMTGDKLGYLNSLPDAAKQIGMENTAIHAAYAKPLGSKEDWMQVRELMDNGMTKAQASQQIVNSNAMREYQAEQQKMASKSMAQRGMGENVTINAPVSITAEEKIDPSKLRRDFETWLNDWCRSQKLKGAG